MRTTKKSALIIAAGLIGLCLASTAGAAEDYKIKLDRPYTVGDKFDISETVTLKLKQTSDKGDDNRDLDFTATASGIETVEAVSDTSKQPSKISFKVAKCTKDGKEIVPAGATVVAENVDGKTQVTVDGNKPDKQIEPALIELFDTTDPTDPPADDGMGTDDRQKVGGTWDLKADEVAKQMQKEQLPLEAGDLKGGGKLEDVSKADGQELEKVSLNIEGGYDKKDLPGNIHITDCKVKFEQTAMMPVDDTLQATQSKSHAVIAMKVDGPDGKAEVSLDRRAETTAKPVK